MQDRADVQSFDFRTLLLTQTMFPSIRTVYLFGDFPIYADQSNPDSDDGTNMQDEYGANTPWMVGLYWPYRVTHLDHPFRAQTSGGFEGMALTSDGEKLLPLLEKPLSGDTGFVQMHEFSLATHHYTGARHRYPMDARGASIGDFIMVEDDKGLVIERDNTQGDLSGFKSIFEITLHAPGTTVGKTLAVNLIHIADPHHISGSPMPGDVGIGNPFAFPFVTIEDVVLIDRWHIGVLNDNNYSFSVGRHAGSGKPDDNEFIVLKLPQPLGCARPNNAN